MGRAALEREAAKGDSFAMTTVGTIEMLEAIGTHDRGNREHDRLAHGIETLKKAAALGNCGADKELRGLKRELNKAGYGGWGKDLVDW